MPTILKKESLFPKLAFWYWFSENAKYGLCMLIFGNQLNSLYAITGISVISIFFAALIFGFLFNQKNNGLIANPCPFEVKLLTLFLAFSGISFFWAEPSNSTLFNIMAWGNIIINFLIFFVIFRYASSSNIVPQAFHGYIYGALLTLIITLAMHPLESVSIQRLGLPGILDATRLGRIMVFGLIFGLFYLFQSKGKKFFRKYLLICILMGYTLIAAFAKVSIVSTLVTITTMVMLSNINHFKKRIFLTAIISIGALVIFASYDRFIGYTAMQGGYALETFSGRQIMWAITLEMIKHNPILGYGSGTRLNTQFLPINSAYADIYVQPTQCPNELLNMWMQYGIIGLLLCIAIHISLVIKAYRLYKAGDRTVSILFLGLMLSNFIRSQFDADLIGIYFPEPFLILFAFWIRDRAHQLSLSRPKASYSESKPPLANLTTTAPNQSFS